AVCRQAVNHRPERRAQLPFRAMAEAQIDPAMRRTAASFDLFQDGVAAEITGDDIFAIFRDAIAMREFFAAVVQKPPAELVAERVPHDWVHADQPRSEMADGKELHEFHIDKLGASTQSERVSVAAHVCGRAVATVE